MNDMLQDFTDENIQAMLPETLAVIVASLAKQVRLQHKVIGELRDVVSTHTRDMRLREDMVTQLRKDRREEGEKYAKLQRHYTMATDRIHELTDRLAEAGNDKRKAKKKVKKAKKR